MRWIVQSTVLCSLVIPMVIAVLSGEILAQTADWRKRNDHGNRYEGLIDLPVGLVDLELRSFVGFREEFSPEASKDLKVRFFLQAPLPVFIKSMELQVVRFYWMESKAKKWNTGAWNEFSPWQTGEVLNKEGIPAKNLGVLIRLREDGVGSGELAPAFVYYSTLPTSVEKYMLYFRPGSTLKKVEYSLYRLGNGREVKIKSSSLQGEKTAGEPFPVELDVRALPEGPMKLVIAGEYKNQVGRPFKEYSFYHKPQPR
jgi:hypothetical protein